MPLSDLLLEILVCPACKGPLEYDRVNEKLTCHACRLRYRVEDDIAVMLIEEAERIGQEPRGGGAQGSGSSDQRRESGPN